MLKAELDLTFAKLMNPRMSAGLLVLHSLLNPLKGSAVKPQTVRANVDKLLKDRKLSKQSITNAARRLEEAKIIERDEGYSVNYGYLVSILLHTVIELSERIDDLEDEIAGLKPSQSNET